MSIKCGPNNECPVLYECIKNQICKHKSIFPLTGYQYGIISLFPICSAICNLSGNSWGEFKVLMLMDLLNYQQNQATIIAYPLITGTALFNFFDLIFKRHPKKNTSLIDYNIVLIIIPNILFGSTIGSLVNKFIPPIVADSLIIPIMIGFSIKFFIRFRNFRRQQKEKAKNKKVQEFVSSRGSDFNASQIKQQLIRKKQISEKVSPIYLETSHDNNKNQHTERERQLSKQIQIDQQIQPVSPSYTTPNHLTTSLQNPPIKTFSENTVPFQMQLTVPKSQNQQKLAELQKYQSGLHLPHVLATICIFLVFQTLSFLVQGKIIPFSICSQYYPIGISLLAVLFLIFDTSMFFYTKHRLAYYKQIGYHYQAKINVPKYYIFICIGAFLGGFNGGVFGIGNSTTVIFTLLYMDLQPYVVSATVGYQVVFAGSASLLQAYITNQIQSNVALLFFLQTFIIGGILSFFAKRYVSQFNQIKVNKILMLIVFCLVTCSVFALIASVILGYIQFGAANMQDVPFHC